LRDVTRLPEDERLWRIGRGFVVRDLPQSEQQLRKMPPFEFENIATSSNENDIVLDAFCGCGTALVSAQLMNRQWVGIDVSPTACRVMAKRLRDVTRLPKDERLWTGR